MFHSVRKARTLLSSTLKYPCSIWRAPVYHCKHISTSCEQRSPVSKITNNVIIHTSAALRIAGPLTNKYAITGVLVFGSQTRREVFIWEQIGKDGVEMYV